MVHFGENEWPILDEYRWPIMMRIYNNFFTLFQNLLRVGLNTLTNQKYRSDLIILNGLFDIPRKTYFLKEKASFRLSKVHLYRNKSNICQISRKFADIIFLNFYTFEYCKAIPPPPAFFKGIQRASPLWSEKVPYYFFV